ncbi:SAP domain-containing protein [Agrilactobacillus composti]|nr:SAP domain-containing protein [Agrilactobacillus composti]
MTTIDLATFKATYYYKQDLVAMCRQWHLPTNGTKAQLNQYIGQFLSGMPVDRIKPAKRLGKVPALTVGDITLNTKLVDSGFRFNAAARQFFANYFGVPHFSFTKGMAALRRQAIAEHNLDVTVRDLIMTYKEGQSRSAEVRPQAEPEEATTNGITLCGPFLRIQRLANTVSV